MSLTQWLTTKGSDEAKRFESFKMLVMTDVLHHLGPSPVIQCRIIET